MVDAIRRASADEGRPLDPDHYGAGFAFRFGAWSDPEVERASKGLRRLRPVDAEALFAVGDEQVILDRIEAYRAAGISKFVLRPIAEGDDAILEQTRRLAETVIPRVHRTG